MPELRRPSLRLVLGFAVALLGFVEIQTLLQTLRSQTRLRDRAVEGLRQAALEARPRVAALLRPGGPAAREAGAREALRATRASEVELLAEGGQKLVFPSPAPVAHWLGPRELEAVRSGEVIAVGPVLGAATRVLAYAGFASEEGPVLLRLSFAVPDIVEDLRERRQLFIGHGVALAVLLLALALALFPGRPEAASTGGALGAYEEAMGRLRDRDQELSQLHEAERRRMGDELREKEALARAGELAAGIAHEVRNGLGTILGYARLLERGDTRPETQDAARGIRGECETLETVIRRFMDYVKRETLNRAPFDLGRTLSRVVARESRGAGAEVVFEKSRDAATLAGDEELLERAFENVVRNAREAAGPEGHVWIDVARDGACVSVNVADDGPGLPAAGRGQPKPFFTTKPGGLGLGLPLAQKIVRLHGGELSFADRSPRGLVVTLRLPVGGSAAGDPTVTGGSASEPASGGEKQRASGPTG